MTKEELDQIKNKLEGYCVYSDRCCQDIRTKLYKLKCPADKVDEIIDYLIDNNLVDETRYANSFAFGKARYNRWGKQKIKAALYKKQIPSKLINSALEKIDDEEYQENLVNLLEKKNAFIGTELTPSKRTEKLLQYGLSRGFESVSILTIIREIVRRDSDWRTDS